MKLFFRNQIAYLYFLCLFKQTIVSGFMVTTDLTGDGKIVSFPSRYGIPNILFFVNFL